MEQGDLLGVIVGATLIGVAALLVLTGLLLSRTRSAKESHDAELEVLKTERDLAISRAIAQPTDINTNWMWEKINEYDYQRGSRP